MRGFERRVEKQRGWDRRDRDASGEDRSVYITRVVESIGDYILGEKRIEENKICHMGY